MALDYRVMDVAAGEHLGDGVPHQLTDAQLALRAAWTAVVTALFVACHKCFQFVTAAIPAATNIVIGNKVGDRDLHGET